jgi:hypothetical protein
MIDPLPGVRPIETTGGVVLEPPLPVEAGELLLFRLSA